MIIVVKPDGSTFTTAASIGYGSTVNEVGIIAPFTNGTMTIAFRLPNGLMLEPKLCTPASATGTDFGVWSFLLTADITAQAGTLGYIVKITDAYGKIWTSALGTFPVTDGVSTILPPIPGSTTYADILAVLSAINTNYQSIKNEIGEPSDPSDPDGTIYARIADLVAEVGYGGSGIYVGSGEMPEGYNIQIDPTAEIDYAIVTSITSDSTDQQIPSAKAVYDLFNNLTEEIADALDNLNTALEGLL